MHVKTVIRDLSQYPVPNGIGLNYVKHTTLRRWCLLSQYPVPNGIGLNTCMGVGEYFTKLKVSIPCSKWDRVKYDPEFCMEAVQRESQYPVPNGIGLNRILKSKT